MVALAEQLAYLGYKGVVVEPDKAAQRLMAAAEDENPFPVAMVGSCEGREEAQSMVARIRKDLGEDAPQFIMLCEIGCVVDREELEKANLHSYLTIPVNHGKLEGVLEEITGHLPDDNSLTDFELQVRNADEAEIVAVDDPNGSGDIPKTWVLLAEDNPINQKVACLMLAKIGYQVDVVVNGYEVLDAVAKKDYAAILMDVQMPEMDGLEAARRIRADDSPARDPMIPIIALTAHAMDTDRQRSLASGMDDHASKPIDSETIAEILSRHIGRPIPKAPPSNSTFVPDLESDHLRPTVRI